MYGPEERLEYKKRKNPWYRGSISRPTPDEMHYILNFSKKRPKFRKRLVNTFLDISTKEAARKASSSVVALLSYTGDGDQELKQCSGVVIENDGNNGYTVLTSATLIRCPTKENTLADALKVFIYLYDGGKYEGVVRAFDLHYSLAWIHFETDSVLPTARLKKVDDYMSVNPANDKPFPPRLHSTHATLVPGDGIVAVGRYCAKPFDLMAAPGVFTIDRCDGLKFECKELFKGTCVITSCGEGGALVNRTGEVIGVPFYEIECTPFLPINIAQKCWERLKRDEKLWRPSLGVVATNLYTADISLLEKVIQKIPNICNGVLVEKVIQGSSLDSAGLHPNDVIVKCGGKTVHSFLEFLEMVWDMKVGDRLQLSVVRICENDPICVNMVVEEVTAENFYHWPRRGSEQLFNY